MKNLQGEAVDESERRWNVRLPEGISASSKRVAIAKC
jgi:hypothetical protein